MKVTPNRDSAAEFYSWVKRGSFYGLRDYAPHAGGSAFDFAPADDVLNEANALMFDDLVPIAKHKGRFRWMQSGKAPALSPLIPRLEIVIQRRQAHL